MFQIEFYFKDWTWKETHKKEEIESWEHALVAFNAYMMNPKCMFCQLNYLPGSEEAPVEILIFKRPFNS